MIRYYTPGSTRLRRAGTPASLRCWQVNTVSSRSRTYGSEMEINAGLQLRVQAVSLSKTDAGASKLGPVHPALSSR